MSVEPAPRFLLLETSGRIGQVALAEGTELRAVRTLDETRRHARDLAPKVAELLAERGWQARDTSAAIVSLGPGSYTGLRVGIMSAKVFAYVTGCAVLGIETFAVLARQAPQDVDSLDVIADAQQEKVYVQRFQRGAAASPLTIRPLADWLADLPLPTAVTGPGLRAYGDRIPPAIRVLDPALREPRIESLLQLGLARYLAGERDDTWAVEPIYLRPSAAEEQWNRRGS